MYQLACKDMGVTNLDPAYNHVITSDTVEEVMTKSMEHVKAAHSDLLKSMASPMQMAEMEKTMKSKITAKP